MPTDRFASSDEDWTPLIASARRGEPQARERLFSLCREPLLVRIRWMMGDQARRIAESGDFLHETLAAALTALPDFEVRGEGACLRWLTAIARNRIRDEVRRHREAALSMLSSSVAEPRIANPPREISVESALDLMDALTRLGADERRLIELRDLEGRSFVEIGAEFRCSDRQAHRLHAKALLKLGRAFRGSEPSSHGGTGGLGLGGNGRASAKDPSP